MATTARVIRITAMVMATPLTALVTDTRAMPVTATAIRVMAMVMEAITAAYTAITP